MHEFLPSTKVILLYYVLRLPESKDSFRNIKFDYCKFIRIYEKSPLRYDFCGNLSTYCKNITLVEGKNSCTSLIMNGLYIREGKSLLS